MAKKKKKCKPTSGWSSIPGNKLDVDIKYGSSAPIEEDEFDVSKWTSPHYGDDESVSSRAERDLWQDNDKYDAASRETDGEFGMLFSLEVIPGVFLVCTVNLHGCVGPNQRSRCLTISLRCACSKTGDSYSVEKSGDETSGFVTKVVLPTQGDKKTISMGQAKLKERKKKQAKDSQKNSHSAKEKTDQGNQGEKAPPVQEDGTEKPLNKRQRQQLKRKARLGDEALEALKQKKKSKIDSSTLETNDSSRIAEEKLSQESTPQLQQSSDNATTEPSPSELISLQTAWSTPLNQTILTSLHSLGYTYPTPIQSATLSAAILGRRDIVGAAPTGSGKTLSFGLPILHWLLENNRKAGKDGALDGDEGSNRDGGEERNRALQALILVPTREVSPSSLTFSS
jgi:hypothetical protein